MSNIEFSPQSTTEIIYPRTVIDTAVANITYIGLAKDTDIATSDAKWQISKVDETTPNIVDKGYANNGNFNQVWDDRAILIYG